VETRLITDTVTYAALKGSRPTCTFTERYVATTVACNVSV